MSLSACKLNPLKFGPIAMGDEPLRRIEDYEEVLVEWLRWNDAHERITEELFQNRFDQDATDAFLNRIDEMRSAVVVRTKKLLSQGK